MILKGAGASPGVAMGTVRIVRTPADCERVREGDVLVTVMTSPLMVTAMQKASAIVTDAGGLLCHAAIVSRELGIPCVVGTGNATLVLRDGQEVIMDGTKGEVRTL